MTARNYDIILTVADATDFVSGNAIVGVTSATVGFIANVNITAKQLKVKLNNVKQEFHDSETITSNSVVISGTANGVLNISISNQENTKASLINAQGVVITEFNILNGKATLNTSGISDGLYFLNVKLGDMESTEKVNIKH